MHITVFCQKLPGDQSQRNQAEPEKQSRTDCREHCTSPCCRLICAALRREHHKGCRLCGGISAGTAGSSTEFSLGLLALRRNLRRGRRLFDGISDGAAGSSTESSTGLRGSVPVRMIKLYLKCRLTTTNCALKFVNRRLHFPSTVRSGLWNPDFSDNTA